MSVLNAATHKANEGGALALMIYAIPNYPDPATYREILAILQEHPAVTIIETAFPVSSGFSRMANDTIQDAHRQASRFQAGAAVLDALQPFAKPSVCVLYRETFETLGYDTVLRKMQGKIDGFLFEWLLPSLDEYADAYERYGIELVQCVTHVMPEDKIAHHLSLAIEEPIVYLVSAPKTGATLYEQAQLAGCVQSIRAHRPRARIYAGFGIRGADDIASLATIDHIDGVIIGTAFIDVMKQGATQVAAFLDGLMPALAHARAH